MQGEFVYIHPPAQKSRNANRDPSSRSTRAKQEPREHPNRCPDLFRPLGALARTAQGKHRDQTEDKHRVIRAKNVFLSFEGDVVRVSWPRTVPQSEMISL